MNILTKIATGIVVSCLLFMYVFYLHEWLQDPDNYIKVVFHHAVALFGLSVLYLLGLGVYKAFKAVTR